MRVVRTTTSQKHLFGGNLIRQFPDVKMSLELEDGNIIECAIFFQMCSGRAESHLSISSQVGCRRGCVFCQSGPRRYGRNLTVEEVVGQVHAIQSYVGLEYIDQLQFMGIGEPLDNMENILESVKVLHPEKASRVGFATCGIVDKLRELARSRHSFDLAFISLHAASNDKRNSLMPVNYRWPIELLLSSARELWASRPRMRVFVNYLGFHGYNDTQSDVRDLARLLKGSERELALMLSRPNNTLPGLAPCTVEQLSMFKTRLLDAGVGNTIVVCESSATAIGAGCGQLTHSHIKGLYTTHP